MKYYVYRHIRLDTNTPFNIGKGSGRRHLQKTNRNQYWHNIVNKHGYKTEILKYFDKEQDALDFECQLIKLYKKLGYCESNLTVGGEGISGYTFSVESKLKISNSLKAYSCTNEHKINISKSISGIKNGKWAGYCYTPFGRFETLKEASNILNIPYNTIRKRCNNIKQSEWFFKKD